ncbi:MAG: hypothetical protein WBD31_00240 [Rubripirellula sp.]
MTNADFRRHVAELLPGVEVRAHHLRHAVQLGYVNPSDSDDGWRDYGHDSVDGMLQYMRRRSRTGRRQLEVAANG